MGQWEPTQLITLGGLAIGMLFGGAARAVNKRKKQADRQQQNKRKPAKPTSVR